MADANLELTDLPAPKAGGARGATDLPMPKYARAAGDPGAETKPASVIDLPAPKGSAREIFDLPMPKSGGISDLPMPKSSGISDLPMPKSGGISDLPMPKSGGISDLPMPKSGGLPRASARAASDLSMPDTAGAGDQLTPKTPSVIDLPAPKGFFDDLPQPTSATPQNQELDLLAPKGFFDDLPQPASATSQNQELDLLAPKGFFDDLPQPAPTASQSRELDLPAPKGFFDDLPQPAPATSQGRELDLPAPKGFFDDLPQPARAKPTTDVAPKGFFDDLPQRANPNQSALELAPAMDSLELTPSTKNPTGSLELTPSTKNPTTPPMLAGDPGAPKGFFDDLPQPRSRFDAPANAPLEVEAPSDVALELQEEAPALELEEPPAAGQFDDLDLSKPSASPVRFETPQNRTPPPTPGPEQGPIRPVSLNRPTSDAALELEEPRPVAEPTPKLAPKRKEKPVDPVSTAKSSGKRNRIVAGVVLGLAVLGGGGFVLYRRQAAAQERDAAIAGQLVMARKALAAEDPNHWQRAAAAASEVIEADPTNGEALGIAAEASFADGLADGKAAAVKFGKGRKMISDALGAGITGPALERAQALSAITAVPAKAVAKLQALSAASPKDGTLALYLGWAQAANGDLDAAIKAFDLASAASPALKVYALYGRARARLVLADIDGAKADFAAVLEISKDHIPAMVGLAAAMPEAQAQQQESDLLAILARKDIAGADPRAVVQAWVLAGDDARRGSRLDAARERYRKAMEIDAKDIAAMTGLSEVELLDKKIDAASELITKALTQSPNDAHAQLVASEISLRQHKLDDAAARLDALAGRTPPLPPLELARLHVVKGRLSELKGNDQGAVDEFIAGAKLAGDLDLTPTMAAVAKLSSMAKDATEAKNDKLATELRDRAGQLLATLAAKANSDPQLAMTLGMAYQQAGDPAKAEPWFRRVIDANPKNPDAMYQLGKALVSLGRAADAVDHLKKAMELASSRAEIGLELARTYEALQLESQAGQLYAKLLALPEPGLEMRIHSGRFFARTGQIDQAAEQGAKILEVDHGNAAGKYLKAEGLLAEGKIDDARKLFTEAATTEKEAQYLDGQGRATEQLAQLRNDLALQDAALNAYKDASKLAPTMFNPLVGMGRLYIARKEEGKALAPLLQASKLLPQDPEVPYLIGVAYQNLDQKPTAIEWLKRSNTLRPRAEASYRLGLLYIDLNQPGAAKSALADATSQGLEEDKKTGVAPPWLTDGLFRLGRVANDAHDEATARDAWEKYVRRNPPPGVQLNEANTALRTSLKR